MTSPENIKVVHLRQNDSLKDAIEIRRQVFVVGMDIPEHIERDGLDSIADHFLIMRGQDPVGTVRLRRIDKCTLKLERCAVLSNFHRQGIGTLLVRSCIAFANKFALSNIVLNSQMSAVKFYETFGFTSVGDTFIEADIEHVKMILVCNKTTNKIS